MMYGSMKHDYFGRKIKKKKPTSEVYGAKYRPDFKELVPSEESYRRTTPEYKSLESSVHSTRKKEPIRYTGSFIIGIATCHKSNAIPITNQQQAIEIARMAN